MSANIDTFYSVRENAWHDPAGRFTKDDYPTTVEQAIEWAIGTPEQPEGWDVVEATDVQYRGINGAGQTVYSADDDTVGDYFPAPDTKRLVRSDNGAALAVPLKTYSVIPNRDGFDLAWAIAEAGGNAAKIETGGALDGGKMVWALVRLDEPVVIEGDFTATLPYAAVKWNHTGMSALRAEFTQVRVVCQNTWHASERESAALGSAIVVRHSSNWQERLEVAKASILGLRANLEAYRTMMNTLSAKTIDEQFLDDVLDELLPVPSAAKATPRVRDNAVRDRTQVRTILASETTAPIAHTAYGVLMGVTEWLDWSKQTRGNRRDSIVKRTILESPAQKTSALKVVRTLAGV